MINFNVAQPFHDHARRDPTALALSVSGMEFSYGELAGRAQALSHWLHPRLRSRRVGVLATRSLGGCIGVLGAAWAGAAYVPISLKLPEERLRTVFELADLDALVVDAAGAALLTEPVRATAPADIIFADPASPPGFATLPAAAAHPPADAGPEDPAYIIFTSGSTGLPKGVVVPNRGLRHYCEITRADCALVPADRVADNAELSFDVSTGAMFMAWEAGASVHVVPPTQALSPGGFIAAHAITVWFSVPSVISFMRQMRHLRPGLFPTLRYSFFAGEALTVDNALAWQEAAPNGVLDNTYGPTELTVIITRQRITDGAPATPGYGTVAIGPAYRGSEAAILSPAGHFLPAGEKGELAFAGPQLATGYLNDPELTEARFPTLAGKRWYRTGDAAYMEPDGTLHHLGRLDNQVKIRGYRVELEDVEAHLRQVSGAHLVGVVGWPLVQGLPAGLVAFTSATSRPPTQIKELLAAQVPAYMVPSQVHVLEEMPLTANGKVDRKALLARLAEKIPA